MACCETKSLDIAGRAAMCCVCPHADEPGIRATACTVNGKPMATCIPQGCPIGRHPVDGIVTWLGIRWYGVPYPVRVWLWIAHPSHRKPSWWPGCGCVKVLKDRWVKSPVVGVH